MRAAQETYLKHLTSLYWENGYNPDVTQMERLAHFADLVAEKNEVLNLVSRKDVDSIIENHVFISSYICKHIPERCTRFIDIGTGGGFPGIPVAIMRPDLRGVLVDSIAKKTAAVAEFVEKLMMSNLCVENARVEDEEFIQKYQGQFDLVFSRATVPLIMLVKYALSLVKEKAYIMALKGGDITEEMKKAQMKYTPFIKKSTVFELHYKPSNIKNIKEKKLVLLELVK